MPTRGERILNPLGVTREKIIRVGMADLLHRISARDPCYCPGEVRGQRKRPRL